MRAKLLQPRMTIRGMGINDLRAYLRALEHMREERGDHSQEVIDTYEFVLAEIERRGLDVKKPEPKTLMAQGVVYKLPAAKLREHIAALERSGAHTEVEGRTLAQLQREAQRRKDHAKYIYRKRKTEAQQCSIP